MKIYLKTTEKISQKFGLLYRAKPYLDETSLKSIYFSYIHSNVDYANISWASACITKLKPLLYKQKQGTYRI